MREAVCATGARPRAGCTHHRNLALEKLPMLQQPMGILPAVSLQCPLLSKLNTVPTDKGTIFKGLKSIFAKQAMKSDFGSGLQ